MKNIQLILWGLGLLWVSTATAFSLGASPYERLRYNAQFCKGDLRRVVYATLKSHTHKGCLKAGLLKLKKPKSKLYRKFDHPYSVDPKIIVKGVHRLETKEVLIRAIEERLGNVDTEKDPRLFSSTEFGEKMFKEDMASFCALMGDYSLIEGQERLSPQQIDFKTLDVGLILTKAHDIDLYHLFEEYTSFLAAFEKTKMINTHQKEEMMKDLKKMRSSFLMLLDNLVVLKKRLSQSKHAHYTSLQLLAQRARVKNALVNISAARHHIYYIEKALRALNSKGGQKEDEVIGGLATPYPNFFHLLVLIRYTDLLNSKCLMS